MVTNRGIKLFIHFVFVAILFLTINACHQFSLHQTEAISNPVDYKIEEDSHINEIIQPYHDSLAQTMNQVIGYSALEMKKGFPEGLLGNFVADLMLDMCNNRLNKKVDFAFTNNGGLRTILPQGDISLRSIYELMPFENEIIILELDYSHMQQLLDYIAESKGIAVSGIRLTIDYEKAIEVYINNKVINDQKIYRVATIDYLANGGSGMSFLEDVEHRDLLGIRLRDMIIEYIKLKQANNEQLTAILDERIKINE